MHRGPHCPPLPHCPRVCCLKFRLPYDHGLPKPPSLLIRGALSPFIKHSPCGLGIAARRPSKLLAQKMGSRHRSRHHASAQLTLENSGSYRSKFSWRAKPQVSDGLRITFFDGKIRAGVTHLLPYEYSPSTPTSADLKSPRRLHLNLRRWASQDNARELRIWNLRHLERESIWHLHCRQTRDL